MINKYKTGFCSNNKNPEYHARCPGSIQNGTRGSIECECSWHGCVHALVSNKAVFPTEQELAKERSKTLTLSLLDEF